MKTRSQTMAEKTQEKTQENRHLLKIKSLEAALSANKQEITGLKNENKKLQVAIKEKDAQIEFLSNEINEVKSQKETKPETHTLASQTEVCIVGGYAVLLEQIFEVSSNYSQAGSSGSILSQAGFLCQASVHILPVLFL